MKKILTFIFIAIALTGCSKKTVETSWKISALPTADEKYEFKAHLQSVEKTPYALIFTKVIVKEINTPPLEISPGQELEDAYREPSGNKSTKVSFDESGEKITFKLSVEYGSDTYSTNGVLNI